MRCSRSPQGARRRVVGAAAFGLTLLGGLVSPLLAGPVGAQEAPGAPLRWEDGAASATMTIAIDGDTLDPGDDVDATITWTYLGPTRTADDVADPAAACRSSLGSTFEEAITDWQPALLLGSSTDVTDYALDPAGITGPVEATLAASEGSGLERLRVEQCLDDGTAIARTTRVYEVTYPIPDDLPDGLYALLTGDLGYPRWWTEGEPTMLAVGAGAAPPVATTAVTDPTATTVAEDPAGEDPGGEDAGAADGTTPTTAATTEATTADGEADGEADAATGDAATGATVAAPADDPSSFRVGVDVARTILAVGGALGALAVAYFGRKDPGRDVAERLRGLNRVATLAALAGVGLSVFVASFDSPFMIGLLGVALCLFPPVAAKGSAAARGRARPPRPPAPGRGSGGRTTPRSTTPGRTPKRAPVLDDELPSGASIDEVRALLERSQSNN